MRYLRVDVYRNSVYGDCTNNGVSVTHKDHLMVPCENGNYTEESILEYGYVALELKPCAIQGRAPHFIQKGEHRWCMFGGNFIYSSDSRFSETYGDSPLKIHDRIESK